MRPLLLASISLLGILPSVLLIDAYQNDRDPFEPGLWIPVLIFLIYGVAALQRLIQGDYHFTGTYTGVSKQGDMLRVLWLALAGQFAFVIGYHLNVGKTFAKQLPQPQGEWHSQRAWVAITVFFIAGAIGYIGLSGMIGEGPRTRLAKGSSMYLFILTTFFNAGAILILADITINGVNVSDWTIELNQPGKVVFGGVLVLGNVVLFRSFAGRGMAFMSFMVGLFLIHYFVRRFTFLETAAVYLATQALPAWTAQIITNLLQLNFGAVITTLQHPHLLRYSPTRPFNNIVILIGGMPKDLSFQYGRTFLSTIFAVVPVQPIPQTHMVYNNVFLNGQSDYGVPVTLIGELYMNFYIPGILVGMLFAGIVVRWFYEYTIVESASPGLIVVFATGLNFKQVITGNFSNSIPQVALKLLPVFVAVLFITGVVYQGLFHGLPDGEEYSG